MQARLVSLSLTMHCTTNCTKKYKHYYTVHTTTYTNALIAIGFLFHLVWPLLLRHGRDAEYDQPACPRPYLWNCWTDRHKNVQIPCGRRSVLLRRRCATLCTSGFMDDVTLKCTVWSQCTPVPDRHRTNVMAIAWQRRFVLWAHGALKIYSVHFGFHTPLGGGRFLV